jgi:hypothetical protein
VPGAEPEAANAAASGMVWSIIHLCAGQCLRKFGDRIQFVALQRHPDSHIGSRQPLHMSGSDGLPLWHVTYYCVT